MTKYLFPILFFIFSNEINSQNKVNLYFSDNCTDKILILDYTLFDMESYESYNSNKSEIEIDSTGTFLLWSQLVSQDYNDSFSLVIEISNLDKYIDTISIPRIRMRTGSELHSPYWKYFKCDKICNGKETDYYLNGNKRKEGTFLNGDPIQISDFRKDGTLETIEFFKIGTLIIERIEYYNLKGKLETYEIHKNKRKKEIKLIYNAQGKFLRKEKNKY